MISEVWNYYEKESESFCEKSGHPRGKENGFDNNKFGFINS